MALNLTKERKARIKAMTLKATKLAKQYPNKTLDEIYKMIEEEGNDLGGTY